MKKYKLKKEVKKYLYLDNTLLNSVLTLEQWQKQGINLAALEEVEERIEFKFDHTVNKDLFGKYLKANRVITEQDKDLCEAILNASESTKESVLKGYNFPIYETIEYYNLYQLVKQNGVIISKRDLKEVVSCLIEYLKRKNER